LKHFAPFHARHSSKAFTAGAAQLCEYTDSLWATGVAVSMAEASLPRPLNTEKK
jgi:hypothetical protein